MAGESFKFRGDLATFQRILERRTAGAAAILGAFVRRNVALATPFDTGRAAASWNASLNGANLREVGPDVSFGSRQSAAQAGETNLQGIRLGDSVHISNSVPYIRDLNAGTSRQAPANFVETVVQKTTSRKAQRVIARQVRTIR